MPLTVSPIGDDLLGHSGMEEEGGTSDEWEDVDLDAEELKVDATRPWREELG